MADKRRITRFKPGLGPSKKKPVILSEGKAISYNDHERIKRALSYNLDLSNQFVMNTPPRQSIVVKDAPSRKVAKPKAAKRKKPICPIFDENEENIRELHEMFCEAEDFELMTEVVSDAKVLKKRKRKRKKPCTSTINNTNTATAIQRTFLQDSSNGADDNNDIAVEDSFISPSNFITCSSTINNTNTATAIQRTFLQDSSNGADDNNDIAVEDSFISPSNFITCSSTKKDTNKALQTLLRHCHIADVISWNKIANLTCSFENCSKLGEGTYGEVFNVLVDGRETALKIIPFAVEIEECSKIVNGDTLKMPSSSLNELFITKELSKLSAEERSGFLTPSYIHLINSAVVKGPYPNSLLDAWDNFKKAKPNLAENQRPDEYATKEQHFILFALSNGGIDLESYKIRYQKESFSIFYQIALSLAIAEEVLEFEHRDLHIGNILIKNCGERETIRYIIEGEPINIISCGVQASIIDFTNSRMKKGNFTVYIDLSEDEDIFGGEGDYQFDIYRHMRELNGNNWVDFTPKTNLLWLHYLSRKLFDQPRLFRKRREVILELCDRLLGVERIKDFLNDQTFLDTFSQCRV